MAGSQSLSLQSNSPPTESQSTNSNPKMEFGRKEFTNFSSPFHPLSPNNQSEKLRLWDLFRSSLASQGARRGLDLGLRNLPIPFMGNLAPPFETHTGRKVVRRGQPVMDLGIWVRLDIVYCLSAYTHSLTLSGTLPSQWFNFQATWNMSTT